MLSAYLLFLAKTVTLLLAALALVIVIAVASRRGRRPRRGLQIRNLTERYDELNHTMRAALLAKPQARREAKERRRRDRARKREQRSAGGQHRPRVFVLDFHGDLRATQVDALREEITAVLAVAEPQDEVLVRLENPGGLVHEQGLAASQLARVRQRGIPLTVAVDKVAASGGYMMACVADRILAAPFALVGSIGVISEFPNFNRLLDRHGVEVEQFKGGDLKRTVTMLGRTTDVDRERMAAEIEDVHALFKEFVATHRPQLEIGTVATGQAWYGTRALELNLVDELVTSDDYLLRARDRADLYGVRYLRPVPMNRRLTSALSRIAGPLLPGIGG